MLYAAYLIPLWAIIVIIGPLAIACLVLTVLRRGQRVAWLRRLAMVLLLGVVAARPATPIAGEQTQRMNANVFFVVDRTGSMNAEDYDGDKPRLDGVKSDMRQVMDMTKGSRYSIIGFDSTAASQLPLTTDAGAAEAWIDTLSTESTAYSRGSNVDRPLNILVRSIAEAKEEDPDSSVLVYFLSDGENTDGKDSGSFAPAAQNIDGGAVLGCGTAQGGRMKTVGGSEDGTYIRSGGSDALSKIDEEQLRTIAEQLGIPYLHRTAPDESLESSMEGITLRAVPAVRTGQAPTFQDWYWVAAIPLAVLMIWELGELTYRLPRRTDRSELVGSIQQGGPR